MTAADKRLKSFKAGERQKTRVSAAAPKPEKPTEAAFTMGFARIEELLDHEAPGAVGDTMDRMLADIAALEERAVTPKEKNAAKKARAAIERTVDLLDYLFRTKAAMQAQVDPSSK